MKKFLGVLGLVSALVSGSAFAHGSISHQAAEAVEAATVKFQKEQPKEVSKLFHSVFAELSGIERFDVTIKLNDQKGEFKFDCSENEDVQPVVWECQ